MRVAIKKEKYFGDGLGEKKDFITTYQFKA